MDLETLFPHRVELPNPGQPLNAKTLPGTGGVCALTDRDGRLILTLSAQNLRRCLMHRFDPPTDARRPRTDLRTVSRCVWWQPTYSTFETAWTYLQIARQLNPDRYLQDLAFAPVWFARINLADPHPRWRPDKLACVPPTHDLGPFRDRASCRHFIERLEDSFDLCRYHDILQQAPQGQACAYKEMGRCPAPCDGSITMEQYRSMLRASLDFALGASDDHLTQLHDRMKTAAGQLQFERASGLREQIARAEKLLKPPGRIHATPQDFRYLCVQRGPGSSRVKPYFIDRGHIRPGQPARIKNLPSVVHQWADNINGPDTEVIEQTAQHRSENLSLVCHFLLKSPKAPGLFIHASELSDPNNLVGRIEERFKRAPRRDTDHTRVDLRNHDPLE
ncbi:MAG: hypothetical protein ACE5GE_03805 [Phycisphaerae bacterium]